ALSGNVTFRNLHPSENTAAERPNFPLPRGPWRPVPQVPMAKTRQTRQFHVKGLSLERKQGAILKSKAHDTRLLEELGFRKSKNLDVLLVRIIPHSGA